MDGDDAYNELTRSDIVDAVLHEHATRSMQTSRRTDGVSRPRRSQRSS